MYIWVATSYEMCMGTHREPLLTGRAMANVCGADSKPHRALRSSRARLETNSPKPRRELASHERFRGVIVCKGHDEEETEKTNDYLDES